ncbi:MAG TPA: imidazole glycerol phosphate synthase subunit HisH [Gemmatimonadaceae bacterium]|jgi:glutamine amidotransferase|nr:imidazole glycerol phosphate synthase subunit HisH [Gemmatimonadaceae bacterium]
MRITLFDYGAGNLHSLAKAMRGDGREVRFESDARAAVDTDVLVLPGVGAFEPAALALAPGRDAMRSAIASGLPCLGVCLGMQLLFDSSDEGPGAGLGVFPGSVTRLRTVRTPHIGWNSIDDANDALFDGAGLATAYYANSFACRPRDESVVTAWSTHDGDRFAAAVRAGHTVGVQFHPEKSSAPGLAFINEYLTRLPNS